MVKRLLMIIGIILLLIIGGFGVRTFMERHNKNQLPATSTQTTKTETTAKEPSVPSFNKKAHSNDDPASAWVVTNKKRPLTPIDYAPTDLVSVGGSQQMRKEAADALGNMFLAAKTAGLTLSADSAYRSYTYQITVYGDEVKTKGQTVADTESARPGFSEHQTGFAVDVGGGSCHIEDCFGDTNEGKWVAANAHTYGFIIRYTTEKQAITGYRAEPWHIRYVGTDLSEEMYKQNVLTLEEFFDLPAAPSY